MYIISVTDGDFLSYSQWSRDKIEKRHYLVNEGLFDQKSIHFRILSNTQAFIIVSSKAEACFIKNKYIDNCIKELLILCMIPIWKTS